MLSTDSGTFDKSSGVHLLAESLAVPLSPQPAAPLSRTDLAKLGHELRTPLNAVIGFANMLADDPNLPTTQREMAQIILNSGEHMLGMIEELLGRGRLLSLSSPPRREPFDLFALVRQVMDMLKLHAAAKDLPLLVRTDASVPRFVSGEHGKLRQVLLNLIGNAIRYTEGGTVEVNLTAQPVAHSPRLDLTITVRDTGVGIAAEDQQRIFDEFARTEQAERMDKTGRGLGLAITRQLVEQMGGSVDVSSAVGQGSVFRVQLRVEMAAAPAGVSSVAQPEEPSASRKRA